MDTVTPNSTPDQGMTFTENPIANTCLRSLFFLNNMKEEIKEKYRTETWLGEDLIGQGINKDAFQNSIILTSEYIIRFYDETKKMEVLCDDDWFMLNYYEVGQDIKNRKGLINWADYSLENKHFKSKEDILLFIKGMIDCFNKREDYEKSAYIHKQTLLYEKH